MKKGIKFLVAVFVLGGVAALTDVFGLTDVSGAVNSAKNQAVAKYHEAVSDTAVQ